MRFNFQKTSYNQPRVIEGISVTKTGRIGLTKFFITSHGIEKGMRAYMYWDPTNKAIAIDFTKNNDAEAYPVGFTQQYGAFINASKFFKLYHLNLNVYARRYPYVKLNGGTIGLPKASAGVFFVDLKMPMIEEKN
ncbi:MAG TPA: hypothetical protein VLH38_02970 [Patescibacteria group bacterium]|nr:hypothetical protein [Patescibacteria group bacterium]